MADASTLVTLQVPSSLGNAWVEGTVYLYGCKTGQTGPAFLSSTTMPISHWLYSGAIVWLFLIVVYLLIAVAAKAL